MTEDLSFEVLEEKSLYRGFFNLSVFRLRHSLFEGGWCEPISRELFHRGTCVAVIPYDPVTERVLLIQQFRVGALPDKSKPWLWEIVAGAVEPGEDPETVARREALEEAGCPLDTLFRIGEFYTSPGGSSEKVTVYCGVFSAETVREGIFGLPDEGENIRTRRVTLDQALALIETGEIDSVVPVLALQWLALNREKLSQPPMT